MTRPAFQIPAATPEYVAARAARQAADKANFHARRAAYDDEGYPQSFDQWRELAEDDLALVPVTRSASGMAL